MPVHVHRDGPVFVVTLDRPEARNAIDRPTAEALASAFRAFEADDTASVAVLAGAGGTFCAGADLRSLAGPHAPRVEPEGDGPLGPTRMELSKPVLAAVEGYAVAGGLELACWADLRIAGRSAVFGVFCRRFGVPLIDGGTARLPRLLGLSRALDLILTGRPVDAAEAQHIGLVHRVVDDGCAVTEAIALAHTLAALPQGALRADLRAARRAFDAAMPDALRAELLGGAAVVASGETAAGAAAFVDGAGRHGQPRTPAPPPSRDPATRR
jgi:enoyl-CoA hydratase